MTGMAGNTHPAGRRRSGGDPSADDLAALQGRWEQVGFEQDGRPDAPDDCGEPGAITTIRGDRFEVRTADGTLLLAGRFELDATAMPRAITWIDATGPDAGRRLPAIYELDGDRFVFIAADAGASRPVDFRGGAGLTLRRFLRRR